MYKGAVAVCGCVMILCGGCRQGNAPAPTPTPSLAADNQLRGVWVSYIELDEWLADGDPQHAADAITQAMDVCAAKGFNAVFWHVRAHGDAYFPTTVWPAAKTMIAGFDPLKHAVEEAHRRGIALHAWVNPYRIGAAPADGGTVFEKNGVWHYAPSDPAVRQAVIDGVRDILDRYAVDGVHFDDYFYPTGMAKAGEPFEDVPPAANVTLWRQTQVDTLISAVYGLCHQYERLFGVSPAADIEKNRSAAYADVTRWMTEAGYIDYICPQLYMGFRHQSKPFLPLLREWASLPRREGVKLYVGLALYKVGLANDPYAGTGAAEWVTDADIIPRQAEAARDVTDGYVLFRYGNVK